MKYTRRQVTKMALAAPLAVGAWPAGLAAARDEVRVPFLQYPLGGGWEGFIIFDRFVAQNHPWLRPVQQETAGYVHNMKVMLADKNLQKTAAFGITTGTIYLAENAFKPFFNEPVDCGNFLHLFGEYMGGQTWLVTFDKDITNVEQLKGQPIGLGLKSQTHWGGLTTFVLEKGYGITADNTPLQSLGPVKAMDALFDGKVKAAMLSVNTDVPPVKNVQVGPTVTRIAASGRDYRMLEWPPEVINKIVKETGVPLYSVELPPNTLPNQPEPFNIFADIFTRAVHKDFPEDVAYELTKAFIEIGPKAGAMSTIGKLWTPQTMVSPFSFDWKYKDKIHPGAKKAYEEANMWPPEKIWKPVAVGK